MRHNSFANGQKNNFRTTHNPEKLLEKYNSLAKEALSAGDKTLSENYLQHADHFMRVIEDRNKNRIHTKPEGNITESKTEPSKDSVVSENQNLKENNNKNSE
tara:strand:- start:1285 stop:1590 length:306 start_codon:yes stop_codon:yes gene_type:complete